MNYWDLFFNTFYGLLFACWIHWKVDDYLTYKVEEFFRFND